MTDFDELVALKLATQSKIMSDGYPSIFVNGNDEAAQIVLDSDWYNELLDRIDNYEETIDDLTGLSETLRGVIEGQKFMIRDLTARNEELVNTLEAYGTHGAIVAERNERILNHRLKIDALKERNALRVQNRKLEAEMDEWRKHRDDVAWLPKTVNES